jgi:hypothetical protein
MNAIRKGGQFPVYVSFARVKGLGHLILQSQALEDKSRSSARTRCLAVLRAEQEVPTGLIIAVWWVTPLARQP